MKLLFAKNKWLLTLCLLTVTVLAACSDDDDRTSYPSVITELVEIHIGSDTLVSEILTDNGTVFTTSQRITAPKPDTLYRCISVYTRGADNHIDLYQLELVPSALPRTPDRFKQHPMEPVKLISTWNSSRYLNISCGILTTGMGTHSIAFCEDSITTKNGLQTVHIRLLHNRPENDAESYTQKTFISMPAFTYAGKADSIALTLNTYDGLRTLGFRF